MQRFRELLHIVVAYCNGATQEEIALTCGTHVQTVRARLRSAGAQTVRARRALADADIEEIRRLHRSGQSARQLARRYGVAHTTVLRYVQQASIDFASAAHAASVLHHYCALLRPRYGYSRNVSRRPGRTLLIVLVVGGIVVAFALFRISVVIGGSWWRFPGMPTAEEWSALFGASALVALGFAWYQIRQVDQSNKALIASNELARQVNLEAVRPRIQVALEPTRFVQKNRGAPVEGTLHIAVRNIGVSPAHDVRLSVSPPFTSLESFFKPGMMSTHFAEVNEAFNGEVHFRTLNPGNSYIWFLGRVPKLFATDASVPRRWEVEAEYMGTSSPSPFREKFVLDLDVEKRIELPVDPLVRIGKDLEVVGSKLEAIKKAVPDELVLSDETISALRAPRPSLRAAVARTRRIPSSLRRRQ